MVVAREQSFGQAVREARRRLLSSADADAFAFVCRHPLAGPALTCIATARADVVVTGPAAALLQALAFAHVGPDGGTRWSSVGNLLPRIDVSGHGLMNRRTLSALVRNLQRVLKTHGVADVLQAHHSYGLRLMARPVAIIWCSAGPRSFRMTRRRGVHPMATRRLSQAGGPGAHQ